MAALLTCEHPTDDIYTDSRILVQLACGDAATNVACNDDSSGCNYGSLTALVTMEPGNMYYIALGGTSSSDHGTGTLTVVPPPTGSPTPPPTRVRF